MKIIEVDISQEIVIEFVKYFTKEVINEKANNKISCSPKKETIVKFFTEL